MSSDNSGSSPEVGGKTHGLTWAMHFLQTAVDMLAEKCHLGNAIASKRDQHLPDQMY